MNGAVARIILRYGLGGLLGAVMTLLVLFKVLDSATAWAFIDRVTNDPDIELLVAMALPFIGGALVEFWYWAAKRFGWST